jgi:hypothetical protein
VFLNILLKESLSENRSDGKARKKTYADPGLSKIKEKIM